MTNAYKVLARKYRPMSFGVIPSDPDDEFVVRVRQILSGHNAVTVDQAIKHASDEAGYNMHPQARKQVAEKWLGVSANG